MELSEFLVWLIGPGAGIAGYNIIRHFKIKIGNFALDLEALSPITKRWLGVLLPGAIAGGAYAIAVGLGYTETPAGAQSWVEALFLVMSAAVVAQLSHGEVELR